MTHPNNLTRKGQEDFPGAAATSLGRRALQIWRKTHRQSQVPVVFHRVYGPRGLGSRSSICFATFALTK